MKGSTLYRRLPDGSWSAQREDPPGPPVAVAPAAAAKSAQSVSAPVGSAPQQPGSAARVNAAQVNPARSSSGRQEDNLAAEVAAVMAGAGLGGAGKPTPAAKPEPAAPVAAAPVAPAPVTPAPAAPPLAVQEALVPASSAAPAGPTAKPGTPAAKPAGAAAMTIAHRTTGRIRSWLRRPGSWKRILLVGAAAYVAWLVFLLGYAALSLQKVPAAAPQEVANTPGTVWLMVGSDSREGLTKKQRRELRTGGDVGQRTDTIMLLHMSGLGAPTLVSIPRDSWLTIPEYTNAAGRTVPAHEAKVNAAFAEGGAPLLNQTLQDATGLHIDHYAEVGFGGIVNLTNAVGGIDVCVEDDIDDVKSGLKLKAGCHSLNGKQALAYVRMRYSDPRGDLGRIERQQEFVAKVAGEVMSWKTLVFPWRQWAIVNAAVDSLAVDEQANLFNVSRLGLGLGQVATGMGEVTTVPTSDSDHWAGGQWVLRWDTEAADRLWQSLGAPSGS